MAHDRRHRDADEEALQAALQESMQPDFLAQILEAEATPAATVRSPTSSVSSDPRVRTASVDERPLPPKIRSASTVVDDDDDDDNDDADVSVRIKKPTALGDPAATDNESDADEDDDVNAHHALLNLADFLLLDILYFLDEDSVGYCIGACRRLRHVAKSEVLFETLCRRIFPVQCPRVAVAAATNRFALRKFSSWFRMLQERPRVRHNGFYYLKTFYYKKPELNMWTDIAPGTILQVVYYRYFSFQRDGTVLYAMIFKPPHEAGAVLKRLPNEVYIGTYQVDKNEVFVSVPTSHNVVEFKFRIRTDKTTRGTNATLVLQEHYAFSEPDRSGWVDYFDTTEEELPFYRQWGL